MSLIAHWTLDETSGLIAHDIVGVGVYPATLSGGMTGDEWDTDHIIGTGSLKFTASSSDYCRVITSPPGVGSGNFSISFWVKTTQVMEGFYTELISKGDWASGAWTVQCNTTTSCLSFLVEGEAVHAHSSVLINDGVWHHCVGTLSADAPRLYIDGFLQATGSRGSVSVTGGEIQFATATFRPGRYLDGNLDDIRYYDHDLTISEIQALYEEGFPASTTTLTSTSTSTSTTLTSTLTSTSTTLTSTSSSSTTGDPRLLGDVELEVGIEAIPIREGVSNLWVGWEPGTGMKSWKVFYAEKPYTNYILGADYQTDPDLFTISDHVRILTNSDITTEVRVLIQNVTAGRQYKTKVFAYKTRTQNTVDKYGISREVYAATGGDINYLQFEITTE